jgi:hypothetical protein
VRCSSALAPTANSVGFSVTLAALTFRRGSGST